MPKKAIVACPVLDVLQKEAAKVAAVAVLHKAIRAGTLSPESQHLLEAIRADLIVDDMPKRTGKTKREVKEKDSSVPADSFLPINENEHQKAEH